MTIFENDAEILVSKFCLETGIFEKNETINVAAGFGLPAGYTVDICPTIPGKVGIWTGKEWTFVDDDRGRVFYNKFTTEKYETQILGEVVNRREFTAIAPPELKENELARFVTEHQEWQVGLDWYEQPVWNQGGEKAFYTGDFLIIGSDITNIEPPAISETQELKLLDSGEWEIIEKQG